MKLVSTALFVLCLPAFAQAQNSGIFVQGGALFDVRYDGTIDGLTTLSTNGTYAWNDLNGDRVFQPGEQGALVGSSLVPALADDRYAPGGVAAVGVFLSPHVSVRLETFFQASHVASTDADLSLYSLTAEHSTRTADIVAAAAWHQGTSRKLSIAYLGGVVFRREREERAYGVIFAAIPRPGGLSLGFSPEREVVAMTSYSAGVMAGLDVTARLNDHFAIVPQVRMISASHGWNVRPVVAMQWHP